MIDCHNHMLPGIDDGAHDYDMALAMAERAIESGIRSVVCTPHHMNGAFLNSRALILNQLDALRERLTQSGLDLELIPGSELHLVPEILTQLQAGEAMTYADRGRAVLVELPKRSIPAGTESILETLVHWDVTPIIAHPERNATIAKDPDIAVQWSTWGCKFQLTSMSCSGRFGESIQDVCRHLVEHGAADLIASDAHRPRGRAPDMREGFAAISAWAGHEAATIMTHANPLNLVSGKPLAKVPVNANSKDATPRRSSRSPRTSAAARQRRPGLLRRLFGRKS